MNAVPETAPVVDPNAIVNDFSIVVATVNGTGSQTANLAILRSLFKMGIPVNGKNIFPSNIQGLPTWYEIRVSYEGYVAKRQTTEILAQVWLFLPEHLRQYRVPLGQILPFR